MKIFFMIFSRKPCESLSDFWDLKWFDWRLNQVRRSERYSLLSWSTKMFTFLLNRISFLSACSIQFCNVQDESCLSKIMLNYELKDELYGDYSDIEVVKSNAESNEVKTFCKLIKKRIQGIIFPPIFSCIHYYSILMLG